MDAKLSGGRALISATLSVPSICFENLQLELWWEYSSRTSSAVGAAVGGRGGRVCVGGSHDVL